VGKFSRGKKKEVVHENLEQALSLERFNRYLAWAASDRDRAIMLYTLNTRLSESLYIPLQTLEVVLRNRIHAVMTEAHHENWFREPGVLLGEWQIAQVAKAIQDIEKARKEAVAGRIVAELTFSFWTGMFGADYEILWQKTLYKIAAPTAPKGLRRKSFSGPLAPIRTLRNRIAHHEPILMWNLGTHHARILELVEWLSLAAALWCREQDRFTQVYPTERMALVETGQENE
jgi:Abi-like protein